MPTARCSATAVGYHSMLIVVSGGSMTEGKLTMLSTTELLDTTNQGRAEGVSRGFRKPPLDFTKY